MQKEFFDKLYRKVQQIDISSCDVTQLIALSGLYDHVRSLVSVMQELAPEFGNSQKIIQRMKALADALIAKMENGIPAVQEMSCLDALFSSFNLFPNRKWEGKILYRAWLLLKGYKEKEKSMTTEEGFEPENEVALCLLLCNCYGEVEDKRLADQAKQMITEWRLKQTKTGEWPELDPVTAMKRLSVMYAYEAYTLDLNFETDRQRGIDYYLHEMEMRKDINDLSEKQVRVFIQAAELLPSVNNPGKGKKLVRQTGIFLERFLKKNKDECLAQDNKQNNKKMESGKIFTGLELNCIRTLAACLLEQLKWEWIEKQDPADTINLGNGTNHLLPVNKYKNTGSTFPFIH